MTAKPHVIDAQISPEGRLEVLSRAEVSKLRDSSQGGLYNVFRNCALAVLNCGSGIDPYRDDRRPPMKLPSEMAR